MTDIRVPKFQSVARVDCLATLATKMKLFAPLSLLMLGACAVMSPPSAVMSPQSRDWRSIATAADRERLRDWRAAFIDGLRRAQAAGHGDDIAREGALLRPDAALGGGAIPNGTYRCRTLKLGAKSEGLLDYIAYPPFTCRVRQEKELQGFAKLSGSQRQIGLLFPGDMMRQVFLGTLVLGDERRAMQYGRDAERDVAGFVERIGPARWRLIMPRPHFESQIDVLELVPAP
jgi:hypothetical protein